MTLKIKLAVRDWDYLTPLALGDVKSTRLVLEMDRLGTLPSNSDTSSPYDAFETSFSRHVSSIAAGDSTSVGIPNFLMRGFRHQCIITRKDSSLTRIEDLAGKRIGVTGWRDSGNIWTRTILRGVGICTEDAMWYAGRLTEALPVQDRLDGFGQPGCIEPMPGEVPLIKGLSEGKLDVVFTPFMPEGYFEANSAFRQLLPDLRTSQIDYFNQVGYVPGIHVLTLNADLDNKHPWVAQELSDLLDESRRVWNRKRQRYADTTPFFLSTLLETAQGLPSTWADSGLEANHTMITDFVEEMHAQGILARRPEVADIFRTKAGLYQPTEP